MRTRTSFLLIAFAVLALGAAEVRYVDHARTFHVSTDTIEGCSCPLFCPCYFNSEPADPLVYAGRMPAWQGAGCAELARLVQSMSAACRSPGVS